MPEQPDAERDGSDNTSQWLVLSDRSAEIDCPRCAGAMVFGELFRTKVVACNHCKGMLIQCEAFGGMVQSLRAGYEGNDDPPRPMDRQQLDVQIHCPGCGSNMEVHPYAGPGNIVIDSCLQCQWVWLDDRELLRVMRGPGSR
jgi:Zn-finger nucleic acid-binding protein